MPDGRKGTRTREQARRTAKNQPALARGYGGASDTHAECGCAACALSRRFLGPDATSIDGPRPFNEGALRKYGQWLLHSIGPDRVWFMPGGGWESHDTLYDRTNGTISFGNIARTQLHPEGKIL